MTYDLQVHFLFSLLQMIPILHSINYSCDLLKYVANLRFENLNFGSANILCVCHFLIFGSKILICNQWNNPTHPNHKFVILFCSFFTFDHLPRAKNNGKYCKHCYYLLSIRFSFRFALNKAMKAFDCMCFFPTCCISPPSLSLFICVFSAYFSLFSFSYNFCFCLFVVIFVIVHLY